MGERERMTVASAGARGRARGPGRRPGGGGAEVGGAAEGCFGSIKSKKS